MRFRSAGFLSTAVIGPNYPAPRQGVDIGITSRMIFGLFIPLILQRYIMPTYTQS